MKIDVKGAEPDVLKRFGKYLHRFRPSILLEVLSDSAAEEINEMMSTLGYVFYDVDDDDRFGPRFVRQSKTVWKSTFPELSLCAPGAHA
jgi:hypothetical protein